MYIYFGIGLASIFCKDSLNDEPDVFLHAKVLEIKCIVNYLKAGLIKSHFENPIYMQGDILRARFSKYG